MLDKEETIENILKSEYEMVLNGEKLYGDFYKNAFEFNNLLNNFIESVDLSRFVFVSFLSQIKKHHTLALFSSARRHHIQAMLNLRQVLEAAVLDGYSIDNFDISKFETNNLSDKDKEKAYLRLQKNFSQGNDFIKKMKKNINKSCAHSNIIYAQKNFKFEEKKGFQTPFFDFPDEYHIKTDLWLVGNIALGLMDLIYGINKKHKSIKFKEDFIRNLLSLQDENDKLKKQMMQSERFKNNQNF